MTEAALYRVYSENATLLYIGVTGNPEARLKRHSSQYGGSEWRDEWSLVEITWFPTREEALEAETAAIRSEHPKYNRAHSLIPVIRVLEPRTMPANALNAWITRREAASILKVSIKTIDRLIRSGRIEPHFIQGSNRIRIKELDVQALICQVHVERGHP